MGAGKIIPGVLFAAVLAGTLALAQAQTQTQPPSVNRPQSQTPHPDAQKKAEITAALRVILPVMRDDLRRAVEMLESLDRRYPGEPDVLTRLAEGYAALGELDSAIAAYQRCVDANPSDVRSGAALGVLHIQQGDRDKGEAVFAKLVVTTGRSVNTYRTIGATLAARGYYDLALRWYNDGRALNESYYVLTLDVAQLHRTMGDYEAALDDYLQLIEISPRHYSLARDQILQLFADERVDAGRLLERLVAASKSGAFARNAEGSEDAAGGAKGGDEGKRESPAGDPKATPQTPGGGARPGVVQPRAPQTATPRAMITELLALVYLQQGMLENALETALEAEKLGDPEGRILFTVAEQAARDSRKQTPERRTRYFDTAVRAIEAYIDGHPNAPQIPRAKLLLVDLLTDVASGRVAPPPGLALDSATARAIETLDWMIASFAGTEHAEEAYIKKGDLIYRVQKKPREAAAVFEQGLSAARLRPVAFAERLGRLYLIIGDYEKAGAYLTRLVNDREPELHETGVYYVGLLLAIEGRYEAARDTLTALAEKNPSSRYTNDAIETSWAIEEGLQGDQKILGRFVTAMRCEVAEDTTGAIAALHDIAALPAEAPLRARSLYQLGGLYRDTGRYQDAMDVYQSLVRDYPTHPRVPDAYRGIGSVYEIGFRDEKRALETYEDILLSYPHYILLDEVRADVNRLREKMGAADGSSS